MSKIKVEKKTTLIGLATLIAVVLVASAGVAVFASSTKPPETACSEVLQLPEGTSVHTDGDRLLIEVPPGYLLANDGVQPHFVTVDPDTVMPLPEGPEGQALLLAVDCDCQGQGGCTEVYQVEKEQIYCDRFDGCPDCEMTVN
jgi:hypothetical protein